MEEHVLHTIRATALLDGLVLIVPMVSSAFGPTSGHCVSAGSFHVVDNCRPCILYSPFSMSTHQGMYVFRKDTSPVFFLKMI